MAELYRGVKSPFLWGAATSAHQVEGNNIHNDWWEWEKNTPNIVRSGTAADHYNLFRQDFREARSLGHNAHRLSLEWSRLELKPGQWNENAFAHYRQVLKELAQLHLSSFVTLHHFTNPLWLTKQGGWLNRKTPYLFARYAAKVAEELGDLIDFWVTINEPMLYASLSFWHGRWPPQHQSLISLLKTIDHLMLGHKQAYHAIHQAIPKARVGIAKHMIAYTPARQTYLDIQAARIGNWWFNNRFLNKTRGTHDYIGVNYYFSRQLKVNLWPPKVKNIPWTGETTDLDWPIDPAGFVSVLQNANQYNLPIYVTENGLADADDSHRADYLRSHLRAIEQVQKQGVDVRGYFYWSLLDNFEWDKGFTPRFGLVKVDYQTQARKPRPSAYVYRAIIESASNKFPPHS